MKEIRTQMNTEYVTAVLHSSADGHNNESDPRIEAANRQNALYETLFGLPEGTVWCEGACEEVLKLRGRK